jgi:maleate cis-trans isomerase
MRGAACAGLYAAAASMLDRLGGPAAASTWRGFVGCIKPRPHDSSLAEMIRLLPVGMEVSFRSIPDVPAEVIYTFIKKRFLGHTGVDGIYIPGSGLDALGLVAALGQDLGIPVVQPIAARLWEIQRRLHVRQPIKGYGSLLETLPA